MIQCFSGSYRRFSLFVGNGVLVDGDVRLFEKGLEFETGHLGIGKVEKHKVVIGAARNEFHAVSGKPVRHSLGVFNDLSLIFLEFGLERFTESDSLACDNVFEALNRTRYTCRHKGGENPFL